MLGDDRGDSVAQTADGGMLFHGEDLHILGEGLDDLLVQRLDRVHVHDGHFDALGSEELGRLHAGFDHQAAGDQRSLAALAQDVGLADLERHALGEDRGRQTGQTQIDRAVDLGGGAHGALGLFRVARAQNGHARQHAHERDVFDRLMGRAVLADGDAGMGERDLDVQVRIAHAVADLLEAAARKDGEGGAERDVAHARQAGGHGDHVRLGDTAVEEAVGMRLGKVLGHRGAGEVRVQRDDLVIFKAEGSEFLAVAHARSLLFTHDLSPPVPSAQRRPVPCSGPCRASRPDFP